MLKNIFLYTFSNIFGQISRLVQEFFIRVLMPPAALGLWSFMTIIQNSVQTFDAGIPSAASWYLSRHRGKGQLDIIQPCQNTSLILHAGQRLLICIVIFMYYVFLKEASAIPIWAILSVILILMAMSMGECFVVFLQSAEDYPGLSRKQNIFWFFYAVFVMTGAYFYKVPGIVVGSALGYLLQAVLLFNALEFKISKKFSWPIAKELFIFAIPFRLIDYPMSLCGILDTILVAKFFSIEMLAIYTTAKLVVNQVSQIPSWVSNVFVMRIYTLHGKDENKAKEFGGFIFKNINFQYMIMLPLLIVIAFSFVQFIVSHWLSKYIEIMPLILILILSIYFQPAVSIIRNYWIVNKKFSLIFYSNLFLITIFLTQFSLIYYKGLLSLDKIAWIYFVSYFFYNMTLFFTIGKVVWSYGKSVLALSFSLIIVIYLYIILCGSAMNTLAVLSIEAWFNSFGKLLLAVFPLFILGFFYNKQLARHGTENESIN